MEKGQWGRLERPRRNRAPIAAALYLADAMVWAMTELMLGPARAEPRVRRL
jgi:phage terminase large subunit-like protein